MNSELAKAQKHAKRFQDLLAFERRKQKTLQVRTTNHTQYPIMNKQQQKTASCGEAMALSAQKLYIDTLTETLGITEKPKNLKREWKT